MGCLREDRRGREPEQRQKSNGQWEAHVDKFPSNPGDRKWSPGQSPNKPHVFMQVSRLIPLRGVFYSAGDPTSGHAQFVWQGEYKLEPAEPPPKKLSRLSWRKT